MGICSAWVAFLDRLCEMYKYGPLGRDAVWFSGLIPFKVKLKENFHMQNLFVIQ
jgi:hypothetical protein